MPKAISKTELLRQINKADVLEVITELVQRTEADPHRQAKINADGVRKTTSIAFGGRCRRL